MTSTPGLPAPALSSTGRYLILAAAFLGWMFSGVQMTLMTLATGVATTEFARDGRLTPLPVQDSESKRTPAAGVLDLRRLWDFSKPSSTSRLSVKEVEPLAKKQTPTWFSYYNCAFLLGAACGGLVFGWIGDRYGRVKAMSISIVWYSLFAGMGYIVVTPEQLLLLRFVSALGVGGMWPSGVSLASEAWSDVSRPLLSGLIGTAANVGIVLLSVMAKYWPLTNESWRWPFLVAGAPAILGVLVWLLVPESPGWLTAREHPQARQNRPSMWAVFRPPLLKLTLLGTALGAIPLLGGWGVTAWLIPWSDNVMGALDPEAKANTAIMRAGGGTLGSLLGGWLANLCGRRTAYFLISLTTLCLGEAIYFWLTPASPWFSAFVFAVGFVSTIFFGWLPLYLPELFPTEARATGTGVSFNFGRILTAAGVLATGVLIVAFKNDYAAAGRVTSLIYAMGMVVILFAPDTTGRKLK